MTKRDFFLLFIKLFGLYSILTIMTSISSYGIFLVSGYNSISSWIYFIFSSVFIIWIVTLMLFHPNRIVRFFHLDKGFDENHIDLKAVSQFAILKAASKNLFYVSRQLNSSKTRQIEGA